MQHVHTCWRTDGRTNNYFPFFSKNVIEFSGSYLQYGKLDATLLSLNNKVGLIKKK